MTTIDARGLACPEPVMRARAALLRSKGGEVEVLVDNATARDNLLRLAAREKRSAEAAERAEGEWAVAFRAAAGGPA